MGVKKAIPIGSIFGRWTVLEEINKQHGFKIKYLCRCQCGVEREVSRCSLIDASSTSCGCSYKTHRLSMTPEYDIWWAMVNRCTNNRDKHWKDYGGRGIKVCEQWQGINGFVNFLNDVGKRPSKLYSLERVNNNKGYESSNVCWETKDKQNTNKRHVDEIDWYPYDIVFAEAKKRGLI